MILVDQWLSSLYDGGSNTRVLCAAVEGGIWSVICASEEQSMVMSPSHADSITVLDCSENRG